MSMTTGIPQLTQFMTSKRGREESIQTNFRVPSGEEVTGKEWPTRVKPFCRLKKQYKRFIEKQVEELGSLQELHYAYRAVEGIATKHQAVTGKLA
jgi:hypothetical protein